MNVITKPMELRRNQGNKKFIIKGINFLLLSLYSIPLVDHVTYHLSKKTPQSAGKAGIIILDDIHRSDEGVCDFWSELNKKHECLEVGTTGNNVSARSPRYGLVMM